jgi:leucyl aminopeptidase
MTSSAPSGIRLVPPSIEVSLGLTVSAGTAVPADATIVGCFVGPDGTVDERLGVDRSQLELNGFTGAVGASMLVTSMDGVARVAVGRGSDDLTSATARDAGASFGRAAGKHVDLAITVPPGGAVEMAVLAQSVVEGILLSRYSFDALRAEPKGTPVRSIALVVAEADVAAAQAGAERGRAFAAATKLSRDLASTSAPPAGSRSRSSEKKNCARWGAVAFSGSTPAVSSRPG